MIAETDEEFQVLLKTFVKQTQKIKEQNKTIINQVYASKTEDLATQGNLIPMIEKDLHAYFDTLGKNTGNLDEEVNEKTRPHFTKLKYTRSLKETGEIFKNEEKIGNFFEDLNFADLVIQFGNPEREINEKLKPDYAKLQTLYRYYLDNINIYSALKELTRDYLEDEKTAFLNALLFFSNLFYTRSTGKPTKLEESGVDCEEDPDFERQILSWSSEHDKEFLNLESQKLKFKQRKLVAFLTSILHNEHAFYNPIDSMIQSGNLPEGLLSLAEINSEAKMFAYALVSKFDAETARRIYGDVLTRLKTDSTYHYCNRAMGALVLVQPNSRNLDKIFSEKVKMLPQHFDALLRRVIRIKLANLHLYTRAFFSSTFDHVFVIVKA